jgi:SanA protein
MRAAATRKLLGASRLAGAMLVLGLAAVLGPNAWVARTAIGHAYASVASVPTRSVAIVPGARVYKGKPFVHLEARLQAALALYRAGRVKAILVSGNDTAESPEVMAMTTWLRDHGVGGVDIWPDAGGARTREIMNRAAGIFDVKDAVICTQDVNVARSLFLAEQAGIDAVAVGVPSNLSRSTRYAQTEALKTALAFFESYVREGPSSLAAERARRAVIAVR